MAANRENDDNRLAADFIAKFLAYNDLDALRHAFVSGEITADRLIEEITARFQSGIGSAVQAIAEHDKAVAEKAAERIRDRIEEQLGLLASRSASKPKKKDDKPKGAESLKDRDDDVLRREYLILKVLSKTDAQVKSATIFEVLRGFDPSLADNVITAHLARMLDMGVLGKAGKGKYHQVAAGAAHIKALAEAIEARGLTLPSQG